MHRPPRRRCLAPLRLLGPSYTRPLSLRSYASRRAPRTPPPSAAAAAAADGLPLLLASHRVQADATFPACSLGDAAHDAAIMGTDFIVSDVPLNNTKNKQLVEK
mmetsp:Transcript_468/g.1229  ORF Transcript_468/g.1229 Transcript_468/m.1229 type:complete len:104 (+) Transcript_468:303-614(+)